jgi:hypothetical protein
MKMLRKECRLGRRIFDRAVMIADGAGGWREIEQADAMRLLERVQERREGVLYGYALNLDRLWRCIEAIAAEWPVGDLADDGRYRPAATGDSAHARNGLGATESAPNRKRAPLGFPARNGGRLL